MPDMSTRYLSLVTILCLVMIAGIFLFSDKVSAKAVRHIHPPAPPVLMPPPAHVLQKIYSNKRASKDIVQAFKDKGLEVQDLPDGMTIPLPNAKESTIFLIPSFGRDMGCTVAIYDSEKKLEDDFAYYLMMNKDSGAPVWRIFKKDNILLLISGSVPEENAREYANVLSLMNNDE